MTEIDSEEPIFVNPFQDINASNMSNSQIVKYWTSPTGFLDDGKIGGIEFVGRTPNIIFGGRGSGKTTILRFLSYDVQKMNYVIKESGEEHNISKFLEQSKFLGVYYRFQAPILTGMVGRGISDERWEVIFLQFMELVLGQLYLKIIESLIHSNALDDFDETNLCKEISLEIFNNVDEAKTISEISAKLKKIQYDIEQWKDDIAFVDIELDTTTIPRTKILYNLPKVFEKYIPQLKNKFIFYLLDEYENLSESQQKIINTLIKQPEYPVSFKIGSREHGLKTVQTLSGEYLREGSDYRSIPFEKIILQNKATYRSMLKEIAQNRISEAWNWGENTPSIESFLGHSLSYSEEALDVLTRVKDPEKYFQDLNNIITERKLDIDYPTLKKKISHPSDPLIEKLNMLLLKRGKKTPDEVETMMNEYLQRRNTLLAKKYQDLYDKNKAGLLFQLISDYAPLPRFHFGFETFANLSSGIIRTFLELCYYAFDEAIFHESGSLKQGKIISHKFQTKAVEIKSKNFFRDIESIPNGVGPTLSDFIDNLGAIFRMLHLDERISEPEPSHFITDYQQLSEKSKKLIDSAVMWSVLQIKDPLGPRSSTDLKEEDYALNRILCPKYNISHRLRGRTIIDPKTVDLLITGSKEEKQIIRQRVGKEGPNTLSQKTMAEFF